MIQDIGPYVYKNSYCPVPPGRESYILIYKNGKVLLKEEEGKIKFPQFKELEDQNEHLYKKYIYLFSIDQSTFYIVDHVKYDGLKDYHLETIQSFRRMQPLQLSFAGITGYQLYNWYQSRKFCGKCGRRMIHDQKERMVKCPVCGQMEYPKICPAVIVGITNGNKLLMSKYASKDFKKYALIAGFAEIGETIEETVKREVMEEVGLKVKNLKFYKSQPWSFTDTLLFGFYAELDGSDQIVLDEEELSFAEWFERDEIPVWEKSVSLTNEMILNFKNNKMQ